MIVNQRAAEIGGALVTVPAVLIALTSIDVNAEPQAPRALAVQPILQYPGRLTDPGSGEPAVDGTCAMTFRFYGTAAGGAALWTEVKDVATRDGLFSTAPGDTVPLEHALFNGHTLWLGINVGGDGEAVPRQQVLPVAYALRLVPGATIQADSPAAALTVTNLGNGPALQFCRCGLQPHGVQLPLWRMRIVRLQTAPTKSSWHRFRRRSRAAGNRSACGRRSAAGEWRGGGGNHTHDGSDITSGRVAESRIAAQLARDAEVTAAINDHAAVDSAHHVRYTDAEAEALAAPGIVTRHELDDHIYGGMHSGRYSAASVINQDGTVATATGNVSSRWDAGWKVYEITIDGVDYAWPSYVTVVPPLIGTANAWSKEGTIPYPFTAPVANPCTTKRCAKK